MNTSGGGPTVLVLGAGGNVSQGILKALALSSLHCRVVAACVTPLGAGLFAADRAYTSPLADSPEFLDWLIATCEREGVDVILSGVEPVLRELAGAAEQIRGRTGALCLVSPPHVLSVGADKLETCRWLERHGLPYPAYAGAGDREALDALAAQAGLPLIAKPRRGKGGHGVATIRSAGDLEAVAGDPEMIVQQVLGDAGAEYTAGSFCDREGRVRGTLVMRRELRDGTTYTARAGNHPDVRAAAERIVSALEPVGPCNVQLRVHEGRPVPFELNVRFSGTTPARARMGFNEVEVAIRHFLLGEDVSLPRVEEGIVLRYWNEMYVDPGSVSSLETGGRLEDPRASPAVVEDWGISW